MHEQIAAGFLCGDTGILEKLSEKNHFHFWFAVSRASKRCLIKKKTETDRKGEFVTTPDPHTGNARVIVGAEQTDRRERVLVQLLQSLEHACNGYK